MAHVVPTKVGIWFSRSLREMTAACEAVQKPGETVGHPQSTHQARSRRGCSIFSRAFATPLRLTFRFLSRSLASQRSAPRQPFGFERVSMQTASAWRALAVCIFSCLAAAAHAEVVRLEIERIAPAFDAREFGDVGTYERIDAIAHFRVDPTHLLNAGIVNLRHARRESDGRVAFDTDVVIYRPASLAKASGVLIYEPVNRGTSLMLGTFNNAATRNMQSPDAAGDGWLMRRGHTLVMSGWQADYPVKVDSPMSVALASRLTRAPGSAALGARLPIIAGRTGLTREQFMDVGSAPTFIGYLTYAAADLEASATLNVREQDEDERTTPAGLTWRYLDQWRVEVTKPNDPAPTAGAIYEFIYTAKDPLVFGLALASMRDLVAFLRYERTNANPLAANGKPIARKTIGYGASQTGRTIKELLYEFNEDERGRIVFDGLHINISGAGKNAVNSEFARPGQKDAQHGPSRLRGDEFPFSYAVTFDPLSRRTDGVLARCTGTNTCPKVIHADSENEMWHGGALTFVDGAKHDLPMPDNVRAFVFAGTEHSASAQTAPPLCQVRPSAAIDWRPMNRALLFALEEWIDGRAPPASHYPKIASGDLVAPDRASVGFPQLSGIQYSGALDARHWLDFAVEPPAVLASYPRLAPRANTDGIMRAGVKHPFVAAPLATHTGWNLRREGLGSGELCVASGMRIPFARTRAEREARSDPRLAIEERYRSAEAYETAVRKAADALVKQRLLLKVDADAIVGQARARYAEAMRAE